MKQKLVATFSVLILAAVLGGCGLFFPGVDISNLKNKSLEYVTGSNGMDKTLFTFDSDGTGGTFQTERYTYDYATAAAEASGQYTDKTWFQDSGTKGTFTYDPDTYTVTMTRTHIYQLMSTATTSYADDYEWHELNVTDDPNVTKTIKENAVFTQDSFNTQIWMATDTENVWDYMYNTVKMNGGSNSKFYFEYITQDYILDMNSSLYIGANRGLSE